MRLVRNAILLLLLVNGGTARSAEPRCVLNPAMMRENWRPSGSVRRGIPDSPWSDGEAKDAARAVQVGLSELTDFFARKPAAVMALRDNAVEPLIDVSYSAANMPRLQTRARDSARAVLVQLLTPYLTHETHSANCKEFPGLIDLAIYSHALLPKADLRISQMVALTNAAYHACDSLPAAVGYDYRRTLAEPNVSRGDIWNLVMWSITWTDAQVVPGLEVPPEASDLAPTLWHFLEHYQLAGARSYQNGALDKNFYDTAYLATHIAYIPTGYGRYPIYMADSPELYSFLRENFYAVLQMGELDLTSEFVDSLRQYGCTEQNDQQVRDGTRYLLRLFHSAGNHWMAYREPGEPSEISDYDAVHKAWTGISGVRARVAERAAPGTYGAVIRRWLGDH
jgi:hypothetical protein